MIRVIWKNSPLRVPPFSPPPFPATLRSWHGKPPTISVTGGSIAPSIVVTSSYSGTPEKRAASTSRHFSSRSQHHSVRHPAFARP